MKWNKKICVEYIAQMKSSLEEEQAKPDVFQELLAAAKARQAEGTQPEVITPPEAI